MIHKLCQILHMSGQASVKQSMKIRFYLKHKIQYCITSFMISMHVILHFNFRMCKVEKKNYNENFFTSERFNPK